MEKYIVETWPDVQKLFDIEGFYDNAYLINDEKGIKDFGSSAYFVLEEWYKRATEKRTFVVAELVFDGKKQLFGEVFEVAENKLVIANVGMGFINNIHLLHGTEEDCVMDKKWECEIADAYKIAVGMQDTREHDVVCYEHTPALVEYPYYSPFLDENLYNFEVEKCHK